MILLSQESQDRNNCSPAGRQSHTDLKLGGKRNREPVQLLSPGFQQAVVRLLTCEGRRRMQGLGCGTAVNRFEGLGIERDGPARDMVRDGVPLLGEGNGPRIVFILQAQQARDELDVEHSHPSASFADVSITPYFSSRLV